MKHLILVLLLTTASLNLAAQITEIDVCGPDDIFRFAKGDTAVIACDSAYALSPERYFSYELMRLTLLKNNSLLVGSITQMRQNYEKRIEELNRDYEDLKKYYGQCDERTKGYLKQIDLSVDKSMVSIQDANLKIDATRALITETREIIKKDIRKQLGSKFLWGAGGVAIGLSVSTAIILLVSK